MKKLLLDEAYKILPIIAVTVFAIWEIHSLKTELVIRIDLAQSSFSSYADTQKQHLTNISKGLASITQSTASTFKTAADNVIENQTPIVEELKHRWITRKDQQPTD